MNLQGLGKVDSGKDLLDIAFGRAKKKAEAYQTDSSRRKVALIDYAKRTEQLRFSIVKQELSTRLVGILRAFPNFEHLDPFYKELVRAMVEYTVLKQSLGALDWAVKQLSRVHKDAAIKLKGAHTTAEVHTVRAAYYGRTSSVIKQISPSLANLEEARRIFKEFPAIKTSVQTVVIAGAPNVGKSTLLAALTGSAPKTSPYPFTTQQLMLGYTTIGDNKVQFIDTPGLLDRPLEKRNAIERQAILALRHLAQLIIFVFDPTEGCGYTLEEQHRLMRDIKQRFEKPVILIANKADIKHGVHLTVDLHVSAQKKEGINELIERVRTALGK